MRHRSEFWRVSLFAALGLCPNACGGRSDHNSSTASEVEGETQETETAIATSGSEASTSAEPVRSTEPSSSTEGVTSSDSSVAEQTASTETAGSTGPVSSSNSEHSTQTSGVSSATESTSEASTGGPSPVVCGGSTPIIARGEPSGIEQCADNGLKHRPSTAVQCTSGLPRTIVFEPEGSFEVQCTSDLDCTDKPHGFCGYADGQVPDLVCTYGCLTDTDCAADELCVCGENVGQCVASSCKQDSDCGDGFMCAYWGETTGIGCPVTPHYVCQTAEDECAVDEDCPPGANGMRCSAAGGSRKCVDIEQVACGRPFLVEGTARLAPLTQGRCQADLEPIGAGLSAVARQVIGAHWAEIGLMEHASIAAFARFALQLMHVGAPHSLLVAAQQAMLDETNHAQVCFDIASRVLGHAVGAGKLPMDHALAENELENIVRLVVREGCIGETMAAMEASEAAAMATEPTIKAALEQIQGDEKRHAELAWRFVQWALQEDAQSPRPTLSAVVAEEFTFARLEVHGERASDARAADETASYGVLSAATRSRVRREALRNVIGPCAEELLRVTQALAEARRDHAHLHA